jgi:hypothetical protein
MSHSDPDTPLADAPFTYHTSKQGLVTIRWHKLVAKTLKGPAAQQFLAKVADLSEHDAQLLMARITGNFKRGNERVATQHSRANNDSD